MERRIGFEIRSLVNLFKRELEKVVGKPVNKRITPIHGYVVNYIMTHENKVYQRDLEENLSMRRSTVSRMLDTMEKNGMIIRSIDPLDNRLKQIILTEDAMKAHQNIKSKIREIDAKMTLGISQEELNVFFTIIDKIKHNLEETT